MQDARSPLSSGSAPGSLCPACGKRVDPLRAGEVAILDGAFHYFCSRECKRSHVDALSERGRPTLDAVTAEPPRVAVAANPAREAAPAVNGAIAKTKNGAAVAPPAIVIPADLPSSPELPPPRSAPRSRAEAGPHAADADEAPRPQVRSGPIAPAAAGRSEVAPLTARGHVTSAVAEPDAGAGAAAEARSSDARDEAGEAAASADDAAAAAVVDEPADSAVGDVPEPAVDTGVQPDRAATRLPIALTYAGASLGLLAWALAIAGHATESARLPFAVLAALAAVARVAVFPARGALPHRGLAASAPLVAVVAATWARIAHEQDAAALASLAGVAAASTVVLAHVADRLLAPLVAAGDRARAALDVEVSVLRDGVTSRVRAARVKPGEQVVVEAGDVVGVDGLVTAGEAVVVPWLDAPGDMKKKEGDCIVAGAKIVTGTLRLMTTWAADERAWARLSTTRSFDDAAPIATLARRALERGAPASGVLVGAALALTGASAPAVVGGAAAALAGVGVWAACAAVAAYHARARLTAMAHGIVFKDAEALHATAAADVAVVCSRGTVLLGEPEIVAIEPLGAAAAKGEGVPEERVLSLAAGAETASTHPFASAILRAARARSVRPENVRNANAHAGLGVTALSAGGERLVVGSRALLLKERVSVALADTRVSELEAAGRSVLLVALDGRLLGLVALQDGLRAGARAAVQRLHDARIEPVLLSGDARDTCETIGRALDIEHIRPEVLPADRGGEVRALAEGGHAVAVLGHPACDDAALGAADVAIAMCAAGSTPGEWSVALASDDVRDAALALGLSREARDRSRAALVAAAVPGALVVLGVAFGALPFAVAPAVALVAQLVVLAQARKLTLP